MHRHTRGLVEHQHMLVLEYHRPLDEGQQACRRPPRTLAGIDSDGRQPHLVAGCNPILRVHALAVHAHLALAQEAVDAAPRHGLEVTHEEIVDALPRFVRGDGAHLDRALRQVRSRRFDGVMSHNLQIFVWQSS
jgi:hypothetical protein